MSPRFYHPDGEVVDPRDVLDDEELVDYYAKRRDAIRHGAIKFSGWVPRDDPMRETE